LEPIDYRPGDPLHLRWLVERDIPEVILIDRLCFGHDSWVEEDFRESTKTRNVVGMVATHREQVLGYMIYELRKREIKLLRLAVLPSQQRRSIGTRCVMKLLEKLNNGRRRTLFVDVPENRLPLQLMLKKAGFLATEILKENESEQYRMVYIV